MKRLCLSSIIFLILFSGVAGAQDLTINPCDQNGINNALSQVYSNGGGTVHLNPGIYDITGQVKIGSNTHLSGDPNAILKVSGSSQWFVDGTGIIGAISEPLNNVVISGFEIDGNLKAFPQSWANSGTGDHNAERLIDLRASAGAVSNYIYIYDMKLHDSYSDAIHISFAHNVFINNVFCSDCQHSSIFYVDVVTGEIYNNSIAGVTSDCIRVDNCQYIKVHDNLLYAFVGDSNGAALGGANGVQSGDEGFSHGGGSAKPDHTSNIEIFNNIFSGKMLHPVWLDAAGLEKGDNVFVHSNTFLSGNIIETNGVSFENPPTMETSERVFQSIFDILKQTFSFSFLDKEIPINASVNIVYFNNSYNPHSLVYVDGEGLSCVKYGYAGLTTTHYLQNDVWTGDLPNTENSIFIQGNLDKSKLYVTVFKSQGFHKITDFNITEIGDDSEKTVFNPELWAFVGTLTLLGLYIFRNLRRVITF